MESSRPSWTSSSLGSWPRMATVVWRFVWHRPARRLSFSPPGPRMSSARRDVVSGSWHRLSRSDSASPRELLRCVIVFFFVLGRVPAASVFALRSYDPPFLSVMHILFKSKLNWIFCATQLMCSDCWTMLQVIIDIVCLWRVNVHSDTEGKLGLTNEWITARICDLVNCVKSRTELFRGEAEQRWHCEDGAVADTTWWLVVAE